MTLVEVAERILSDPRRVGSEFHVPIGLAMSGVGMVAIASLVIIVLPLLAHRFRLWRLCRRIEMISGDEATQSDTRRERLRELLEGSALHSQAQEFITRWNDACIGLDRGVLARAPLRFSHVLADVPLLPRGLRRNLLPALPLLLVGAGIAGTLATLGADGHEWQPMFGVALRASVAGLLLALPFAVVAHWLEGSYDACAHRLERAIEATYPFANPEWVARLESESRRDRGERWQEELRSTLRALSTSLEEGQKRTERSAVEAASLVSEEQRGALSTLVAELQWSVHRGVEEHLGALRDALHATVDHQQSLDAGLDVSSTRLREGSEAQRESARSLDDAGRRVGEAAQAISRAAEDLEPVLNGLAQLGETLTQSTASLQERREQSDEGLLAVRDAMRDASRSLEEQRATLGRGVESAEAFFERTSRATGPELESAFTRLDEALTSFASRLEGLAARAEWLPRSSPGTATEGSRGWQPIQPKPPTSEPRYAGRSNDRDATLRYSELYREHPPAQPPHQASAASSAVAPTPSAGGLSGLLRGAPPPHEDPRTRESSHPESDED